MGRNHCLQGLRAVAALLVVLFHVEALFWIKTKVTAFGGLFENGYRGVDLFFVLSGFIITFVHFRDVGQPRQFIAYVRKRLTRVYPLLFIISTFAFFMYSVGFGNESKLGRGDVWDIIASFALLPQHGDPLVNVSWTLKYEIAFYGLFGLCILNRAFGLLVLGLWQAAALVAAIYAPHLADGLGGFYLRSLVLEFAVGMGCAWLLSQSWFERLFARQGWRLAAVGAVVFGLGMRGGYGVCCACGAALLILGLMLAERSAGGLRLPSALIVLGDASYAIYLMHFSVAAILMSLTIRLHLPLNSAVALAIAVVATAAGVAIDRIVDRPVQRLLARRSRPVAAPANQHMILNA